jgi:hypothetical protein
MDKSQDPGYTSRIRNAALQIPLFSSLYAATSTFGGGGTTFGQAAQPSAFGGSTAFNKPAGAFGLTSSQPGGGLFGTTTTSQAGGGGGLFSQPATTGFGAGNVPLGQTDL